jgi:hypothetical protein
LYALCMTSSMSLSASLIAHLPRSKTIPKDEKSSVSGSFLFV